MSDLPPPRPPANDMQHRCNSEASDSSCNCDRSRKLAGAAPQPTCTKLGPTVDDGCDNNLYIQEDADPSGAWALHLRHRQHIGFIIFCVSHAHATHLVREYLLQALPSGRVLEKVSTLSSSSRMPPFQCHCSTRLAFLTGLRLPNQIQKMRTFLCYFVLHSL